MTARDRLHEIAPGVYWLELGRGLRAANVYMVRSEPSWALIDAGWPRDAAAIRRAAATLFGHDVRPASILLSHFHPDHAGAVPELAMLWDLPAWVHPGELGLARGDAHAVRHYAGPLDRYAILPALRLMGARRMEALLARSGLGSVARPLDPNAGVPGLPDWDVVHTPGHTPGHVAFVRRGDRVAVTGDAVLTVDLNSLRGILLQRPRIGDAPWYTTWDRRLARASAARIARLRPSVVAGGHGAPMTGRLAEARLREYLARSSA